MLEKTRIVIQQVTTIWKLYTNNITILIKIISNDFIDMYRTLIRIECVYIMLMNK